MRRAKPAGAAAGAAAVGHPVDVATGTLFLDCDDFILEGRVPLVLARRYSTALLAQPPSALFGRGWWSPLETALRRDLDGLQLRAGGGEHLVTFDDPDGALDRGGVVRNLGAFSEVRRSAEDAWEVTGWDPSAGTVTRYTFDARAPAGWWPLRRVEEVGRGALDLLRDEGGRLREVRQAREGRALALEYDGAGRVAALALAAPGAAAQPVGRYAYDAAGRLVRFADAGGFVTEYSYDAGGRMVGESTPGGAAYRFAYDARGRCVETTAQGRYDYKALAYADAGDWTRVTDSVGGETLYRLDEAGRVTTRVSAAGLVAAYEFDEHGRPTAHTLPEDGGLTTRFAYDAAGNRSEVARGWGGVYAFAFDDRHLPVAATDPAGRRWTREYDAAGFVTATANPLGETWGSAYDDRHDLVAVAAPHGHRRLLEYDARGDVVRVTDYEGAVTHYAYEPRGYLTRLVDPLGRETRAAWDARGNMTEVREPDGARRRYQYGPEGEVVAIEDENGHAHRLEYLFSGYVRSTESANGERVTYEWTTEPGVLAAVVNAAGARHSFERDLDGRILVERTFDGRELRRAYDGPRLASVTDQDGHVTRLGYDAAGALARREHDDGTWVAFTYDPALGLMTGASNAGSRAEFAYDDAGQLLSEAVTTAAGAYRVESRYDVMGNRVERRTSTGHVARYTHSPNGNLRALAADGRPAVTFRYNAAGEEVARAFPGGGDLTHEYDARGRVTRQRVRRRGGAPDVLSGRASVGGGGIDRRYRYDPHGSLTLLQDAFWR
jgi:YD repeat-containing protein